MSSIYGGSLGELHPEQEDVVNAALERWKDGEATPEDRVILWFDAMHNYLLGEYQAAHDQLWSIGVVLKVHNPEEYEDHKPECLRSS